MKRISWTGLLVAVCAVSACSSESEPQNEIEPFGSGPYAVGSTNMRIAAEHEGIGDEAMHKHLLGIPDDAGRPQYIADLLEHPDAAWLTDVPVPDDKDIYGPASGLTLPVVTFVAFPSAPQQQTNSYAFPYYDAMYGSFADMLRPGESPSFADPDAKYPLIILAHGGSAHGVYDVGHAHDLARHGYIVAVINYGDDRTAIPDDPNVHVAFLRPHITKAVLDSLLESETFGKHIDAENVGMSGHSFGGFTILAIAGGHVGGNEASIVDSRIKAGVIAAPWTGGSYDGSEIYAFGDDNNSLVNVDIPIISFFGTKDTVTLASSILPAIKKLSGPTYVIELVDQPHVFEGGSWEDRNGWELLFFSAYLKHDAAALDTLRTGDSMKGGNVDIQLFDYQKTVLTK